MKQDPGWSIVEGSGREDDPGCPARLAFLLGRPFDLNRATFQDLERLPGIGPKMAGRIIRAREATGGFSRLPSAVPGVNQRALQSLERWSVVGVVEAGDE